MEYKIPVTKDNVCNAILTILNFHLKLSEFEIKMISILLQNKISTIDTSARDLLRKVLDKDKFSINNYVKRLVDKNIILKEDKTKKLYIDPTIIKLTNEKEINFKFISND